MPSIIPSKDYIVSSMSINRYANPMQHSINGSVTYTPGAQQVSVDCVIDLPNDQYLGSLEDFEALLKGRPNWCTDLMLEEALKLKFPERYL